MKFLKKFLALLLLTLFAFFPSRAAVVPHATKVASFSPAAYWQLGSSSEVDGATVSGTGVAFAQSSLLKDGTGNAARLTGSGSISKSNYITAPTGATLSFIFQLNALPTTTQTLVRLGNVNNNQQMLRLSVTSSGTLRANVGVTSGFYQAEYQGLVTGRIYSVALTVDYVTHAVKIYLDGRDVSTGTTSSPTIALSNATMAVEAGASIDFTVDEAAAFPSVLSAASIRLLVLSARAVDESATEFYTSPTASYFGRGTDADPTDLQFLLNGGIVGPGHSVLLKAGDYIPTSSYRVYLRGEDGARIKIRAKEGDHARVILRIKDRAFYLELTSQYVDFIGQTYAKTGGIAGIEILNDDQNRIAVTSGLDPESSNSGIYAGTLTNATFTVPPNSNATNGPYIFNNLNGLTFRLYNNGAEVFSSTIASTDTPYQLTLTTPYSGTQALGGTWYATIPESSGGRDNQGGVSSYGFRNRIINAIVHDLATGLNVWEPATDNEIYGGVIWNNGYTTVARPSGTGSYNQNNNRTKSSYLKLRHTVYMRPWDSTIRVYGSDQSYTENAEVAHNVIVGGEAREIMGHDLLPTVKATVAVTSGSTVVTVASFSVNTTFTNHQSIRIKHPSGGFDHYTRIRGISGSTLTLQDAVPFTSAATQATVSDGSSFAYAYQILVGSGNYSAPSRAINANNNRSFAPFDGRDIGGFSFGYEVDNDDVSITDNYIVGAGVNVTDWKNITSNGNTIVYQFTNPAHSGYRGLYRQSRHSVPGTYSVENNKYFAVNHPDTTLFMDTFVHGATIHNHQTFANWQSTTGFDDGPASTFSASKPTVNQTFVDAQDGAVGQLGRANITVYNWENLASVSVNICSTGLINGQNYEIRDTEDYLDTIVATGTFNSGTCSAVSIPMNGTQIAQPTGWTESGLGKLNPHKPLFGAFVLLPFAPPTATVPNAPVLRSVLRGTNTSINASWDAPAAGEAPTGYKAQATNLRTGETTIVTLGGSVYSHVFTGLVTGDAYRVSVRATNAAGDGAFSATIDRTLTGCFPSRRIVPCLPAGSTGVIEHANKIVRPKAPTAPVGTWITDQVFGTDVMRITDGSYGASGLVGYSYTPSMNYAEDKILEISQGKYFPFNPTTRVLGAAVTLTLPAGGFGSWEDAQWSQLAATPNRLWVHRDMGIYAVDTATNTNALIKDLSASFPSQYIFQMSMDGADDRFCFATKSTVNYTFQRFACWDRSSDALVLNRAIADTGLGLALDEIQIAKSGAYAHVKFESNAGISPVEVQQYNLNAGDLAAVAASAVNLTDAAPHHSPGHSDSGNSLICGDANQLGKITCRSFTNPTAFTEVFDNSSYINYHVSMKNQNGDDWFLISTFGEEDVDGETLPNTPANEPKYLTELVLIKTDGTRFRRFLHTHAKWKAGEYWSQPRANISRTGRWIVFSSTWGTDASGSEGVNGPQLFIADAAGLF